MIMIIMIIIVFDNWIIVIFNNNDNNDNDNNDNNNVSNNDNDNNKSNYNNSNSTTFYGNRINYKYHIMITIYVMAKQLFYRGRTQEALWRERVKLPPLAKHQECSTRPNRDLFLTVCELLCCSIHI